MTVPHHLGNGKKGHGWESHVGPILGKQMEVHQNLWRGQHVTLKKKEKKKASTYIILIHLL